MAYGLYIASFVGAIAMAMMLPRARRSGRGGGGGNGSAARFGMLLGAASLGGVWLWLSEQLLPAAESWGISRPAMVYYYIFSAIAIVAAVRVITHTKPVYSALWFVMVILASAGMFLLLDAEFMAAAMVIIYGGAILVTYVFVIMLASEPGEAGGPGSGGGIGIEIAPEYETVSREPIGACAAGFLLLAVLLSVAFSPIAPNPEAAGPTDAQLLTSVLTDRPAVRLSHITDDPRLAEVMSVNNIDNSERVGLDLFESHPLGLELAGVILLVSLVGAVIIARQQVPLNDPPTTSPTLPTSPEA